MQILVNNLDLVKELAVLASESPDTVLVSDGARTVDASDVLQVMQLDVNRPLTLHGAGSPELTAFASQVKP